MPIIKMQLSENDKKILKRVFKIRITLGFFFLIPLLFGLALLLYNSIVDLKENNQDFMTFVGIIISVFSGYLFYKFVIPFYKNSYKNILANNKLVIETKICTIKESYTKKGVRYVVETDDIIINSWQVAILSSRLPFSEMKENMKIKIHQIETNSTDILYIEKY
jgi:cytochrome c biogenesis protein CcdA